MADQTEQSMTGTGDKHFCAHCGTENAKDGYACTRCGERLVEVHADSPSPLGLNSCPKCGNANNTRAAYCWVCGSDMQNAVRITPKAQTQPEVTIPSAATPRTYRPDLNPSPGSSDAPDAPRQGSQPDLRGPAPSRDDRSQPESTISQENPFGSPDSPVDNTSGIKDGEIPKEIKKWNWAAFLMPAIWGIFSGVPYTAILFGAAFLPPTIQLVVMVTASLYLGAKGNELSWRGKKWRSVEHFQAFHKQWTSWAVKLTIAVAALLLLYVMAVSGS